MTKYLIKSAYGEWNEELQEWVDYGDGTRFRDEDAAYDVASRLNGRKLRIEGTNGLVLTKLAQHR